MLVVPLSGIPRSSGFGAVRDFAPFGTPRLSVTRTLDPSSLPLLGTTVLRKRGLMTDDSN